MSGKTKRVLSIEAQLRKENGELRKQIEELREAIDDLTTEKAAFKETNDHLTQLLNNEREASHLLRMDAYAEKDRRTIAENENFTLKRSLAIYANAEGGRADVVRMLPTLQINRSGHIA